MNCVIGSSSSAIIGRRMADTHSLASKLTYRPTRKLEVFYTGGAARLTRDGKLLACACGDEVKVRRRSVARCRDGDGGGMGRAPAWLPPMGWLLRVLLVTHTPHPTHILSCQCWLEMTVMRKAITDARHWHMTVRPPRPTL